MASSLDNTNKHKIAGIGEDPQKGYMKNLNEKLGITNHYDIREHFKSIENKIWGAAGLNTETRAFIDGLIQIIYNDIRYPLKKNGQSKNKNLSENTQKQEQKRSRLIDADVEIKNANKLAEIVTNSIQGKQDDGNNETIGKTMEKLEPKFKKIENPNETFNNFVCCLLMSELPKSSIVKPDEIKANLFTGVFQSWNLLQKLGQVEETQLEGILFNEKNKKPTIESIVNRKRAKQIERGFNKMKEFINESKNIRINDLDSFCKNEEAIQNLFYECFIDDSDGKRIIKITDFAKCYVSVKTYPTNIENFKNHLQWEIDEVQKYFNFKTTENVSSLQKQLVDLWKQVKDNVNDVKKWKQFVIENSSKGTTHVVPCSLNKLECLQINLNRSKEAWNQVVNNWLKGKKKRHIVFIQEPCIEKMEITRPDVKETNKKDYCYYFPNLPTDYRAIHNIYLTDKEDQELANVDDDAKSRSGERIHISAILVHEDVSFERILPMAAIHDNYNYPQELLAGIRLTGQGWNGVTLFSIYCRPIRSLAMILQPLRLLFDNHDMTRTVLCMDANATHPNWSPAQENAGLYSGRGEDLEYFRTSCKLKVANQNFEKGNSQPTRDDTENEPEPDTENEPEPDTENEPEPDTENEPEPDTENEPENDQANAENKKERKPKHIDVTFYRGDLLCTKEKEDRREDHWKRLEDETKSDHRYITFSIKKYSEDAKKSSPHLSSLKSCLGRN